MSEDEAERFSVVYDGGLASEGQLHFYEYGRAAYAVARLVATVEHFRRTGHVASRISSRSYVDVIINAPERGSFPIDILIPLGEALKGASAFTGIPAGVFVKYAIHLVARLLPKQEDTIKQLAELELKRSKEETARVREIRKMVESGNVTTRLALDVVQDALASTDSRIAGLGIGQQEMTTIARALRESEQREAEFEPHRARLEQIDQRKLVRLASKIRPQIAEAGLPLRRSAKTMRLAHGAEKKPFATLTERTIEDIAGRTIDLDTTTINLRVIAYDRDHGIGKCDLLDHGLLRVSFTVPVNARRKLKRKIVAALEVEVASADVRFFRNRDGEITSILIEDIFIEAVPDE